jgi:hypothetical protein
MPLFHFVSIYIVPIFLDYHIEGTSLSVFIQKKGKKKEKGEPLAQEIIVKSMIIAPYNIVHLFRPHLVELRPTSAPFVYCSYIVLRICFYLFSQNELEA